MESMIVVYVHLKCTTCKKALSFLKARSIEFEVKDITKTPPSKKELALAFNTVSPNVRKIINTSGNLYKEMGLKDKIEQLSKNEIIELLSKNGMLVKRPLIILGDRCVAGFDEESWKELLSC